MLPLEAVLPIRKSTLVIAFTVFVSGCTTVVYNAAETPPQPIMSASKARKQIKELLETQYGPAGRTARVARLDFRPDGVLVLMERPGGYLRKVFYEFSKPQTFQVTNRGALWGVYEECWEIGIDSCWNHEDGQGYAREFADALYALKVGGGGVPEKEANDFHSIALDYRKKDPKPKLPQATIELKKQAESAAKAGRYNSAIDFYTEALSATPWWPYGHYNLAFLLEQQNRKDEAAGEMKKFLDLVPDAVEAEKAKEKIKFWTGKS